MHFGWHHLRVAPLLTALFISLGMTGNVWAKSHHASLGADSECEMHCAEPPSPAAPEPDTTVMGHECPHCRAKAPALEGRRSQGSSVEPARPFGRTHDTNRSLAAACETACQLNNGSNAPSGEEPIVPVPPSPPAPRGVTPGGSHLAEPGSSRLPAVSLCHGLRPGFRTLPDHPPEI